MIIKCPKCEVTVELLDGGMGFLFGSRAICADLRGTQWGEAGEYDWCPTLAAALPPGNHWPGATHRDEVLAAIAKVGRG